MNDKCCGIFGRIFGHKFEARYDTNDSSQPSVPNSEAPKFLKEALDAYYERAVYMDDDQISCITSGFSDMETDGGNSESKTYVHDVCVRCGLIVKKS